MDLQIRVRKQVLTCRQVTISNSVNFIRASFQFDDEWNGTEKHVIFSNGDIPTVEVLLDESLSCVVPWEVLQEEGDLYVSVVGIRGDTTITTKLMDEPIKVYASGELGGSDPKEPSQTIWDQISATYQIEGTTEDPFDFSSMDSLLKLRFGLNVVKGVMKHAPADDEGITEGDEQLALLFSSYVFNAQISSLDIPVTGDSVETTHVDMVFLTSLPIADMSWTKSGTRQITGAGETATTEDSVEPWTSLGVVDGTDYVESITLDSSIDEDHLSLSATEEPVDPDDESGRKRIQILLNTKNIGRNSSLNTTNKRTLVEAINEVFTTVLATNVVNGQPKLCLTGNVFNRYNNPTQDIQESIITYDDSTSIASGSAPEVYGEILRTGSNAVAAVRATYLGNPDTILLYDSGTAALYGITSQGVTYIRTFPTKVAVPDGSLCWSAGSAPKIFILTQPTISLENKVKRLDVTTGAVSVLPLSFYMSARVDPMLFARLSDAVAVLAYTGTVASNPVWRVFDSNGSVSQATALPNKGVVDSIFSNGRTYGWTVVSGGQLKFYTSFASTFREEAGTLKHSEAQDSTSRYSKFAYNEDYTKLYRYVYKSAKYYLEERDATTFEVSAEHIIENTSSVLPANLTIEVTCPVVFNGLLISRTSTEPDSKLEYFQLETDKWVPKVLSCPEARTLMVLPSSAYLCGSSVTVITKKKRYNLM